MATSPSVSNPPLRLDGLTRGAFLDRELTIGRRAAAEEEEEDPCCPICLFPPPQQQRVELACCENIICRDCLARVTECPLCRKRLPPSSRLSSNQAQLVYSEDDSVFCTERTETGSTTPAFSSPPLGR